MTINNYDATDLALVQQGYPDDIRQLVYTLEEGEEGTPHIQAYIKMKRQVRLSHMKKLFPRGNFAFLDSAEYRLNSQRYAQKLDPTARSPAVIQNGDPLHTIEGTVRRIVNRMIDEYGDEEDLSVARRWAERDMVVEDYTMAKVFVSATYKNMWKEFGHDMYECLFDKKQADSESRVEIPVHTHTHTHTDEKFSHENGIAEDASEGDDASGSQDDSSSQEDGEDYEDGGSATDEGDDEGSSADDSASSVGTGGGE